MAEENNKDDTVSLGEYNKAVERAQKFEAKLTDLEKQLEKFSGLDIEKLKADSEALKNRSIEDAKKGDDKDVEALLAATEQRVRDELAPKIESLESELAGSSSKIKELTIVDKGFGKIAGGFNDDTHEFIKDLVRKNVDLDTEGNFIVKDKEGKPRYSKGSANKPMSLDEYASELAEAHPSFAKATTTNGSKQPGTTRSSGGGSDEVNQYLNMTPEQRSGLSVADNHRLAVEAVKLTN